ncbi:hypothetical protein G6F56_008368 [Rhizopus delemar]|nr:hypothetical protein G6F56_008368 [Rhizopus delemar]
MRRSVVCIPSADSPPLERHRPTIISSTLDQLFLSSQNRKRPCHLKHNGNEAAAYDEVPSFRLKKLVKNNNYLELHEIEVPDVSMKEASIRKERDTEYSIYTEKDRLLYLYFVFEKGMKNKEAVAAANVNLHTARKWKQKYQQSPEEYVPYKLTNLVPSRPVSQLDDTHKDHLATFLSKQFQRHPTARNSPTVIEKRAVWVEEWLAKGMLYLQNCVFLDESGFDINMTRERAWSARGEPAIVETPSGRATSHTVLGAISSVGVVNVSMREPGNVKRRKMAGATKRKAPSDKISMPKGTTGAHYMHFIIDTMDIMDTFPKMQGFHIVMDNAPIHIPSVIDPLIEKRGYIPVYLPPYSPELNPIENFWSIVKSKVKRHSLKDTETLTSRIVESCEEVPLQHLQNCIQHSVKQFDKCLNKEPI